MEQEPPKKDELNGNVIEFRKGLGATSRKDAVSTGSVVAFEKGKQSFVNKNLNLGKAEECFSQGLALEDAGQFIHAEKKYLEALSFNPHATGALINLAAIYIKSSSLTDTRKAEACLLKAMEIDPTYSLAVYNLGCVYDKLQKQASASFCFAKALEIDPGYADAAYNLADCLEDEQSYQLALDYYNLFLKLDQSDNSFTEEAKKQVKILQERLK